MRLIYSNMTPSLDIQHIAHLTGHKGAIYTLCGDSDPHCFYSAGGDGWIVKWDVRRPETGTAIAQVPTQIFAMCYLPDVHLLAVGSMQGVLYFIDLASSQVIPPTLQLTGSIYALACSREQLYIGTGKGQLYIYCLQTQQIKATTPISEKSIRCITLHPFLPCLAIGSSDHLIHLYHLTKHVIIPVSCEHESSIFSLLFHPNGEKLLSGSRDAHIGVWKWKTNTHQTFNLSFQQKIPAHHFTINHLISKHDGTLFFSASRDKSIKIWQTEKMQLLKVIDQSKEGLPTHKNSINRLLWFPEYNYLISGSDDRSIMIYKIQL